MLGIEFAEQPISDGSFNSFQSKPIEQPNLSKEEGVIDLQSRAREFFREFSRINDIITVYEFLKEAAPFLSVNQMIHIISDLENKLIETTTVGKKLVADFFLQKEISLYNTHRESGELEPIEKIWFLFFDGDLRFATNLKGEKIRNKEAPYFLAPEKTEVAAIASLYSKQKNVEEGEGISIVDVLLEFADVLYNLFQYQALDRGNTLDTEKILQNLYTVLGMTEQQASLLVVAKYFARLFKNSGKNDDSKEAEIVQYLIDNKMIPEVTKLQISNFVEIFCYAEKLLKARAQMLIEDYNMDLRMQQITAQSNLNSNSNPDLQK